MDVTGAEKKLAEANYFLFQSNTNTANTQAFPYLVNAFLYSSRSVIYQLKRSLDKEYGRDASVVREWWDRISQDPVIEFFRDARDREVHERPTPPTPAMISAVYTVPTGSRELETFSRGKHYGHPFAVVPGVGTVQAADLPLQPGASVSRLEWFFDDNPTKPVMALCQEFSRRLSGLMEEVRGGL